MVYGDYVAAVFGDDLVIGDSMNPAMVVELARRPLAGSTYYALAEVDGYLFVAAQAWRGSWDGELEIYDTRDAGSPSAPTLLGTELLPGQPQSIAVAGNRMYVAAKEGGTHVFDLVRRLPPDWYLRGRVWLPSLANAP